MSSEESATTDDKSGHIESLKELQKEAETDTEFIKEVDGKKELRYYPDRPSKHVHKQIFVAKMPSQFYDPCALTSKMAVKCMEQHDEDYKEVCGEYFRAYRECKKEWLQKKREGTW